MHTEKSQARTLKTRSSSHQEKECKMIQEIDRNLEQNNGADQ